MGLGCAAAALPLLPLIVQVCAQGSKAFEQRAGRLIRG